MGWVSEIRTQRIMHNHVIQVQTENCPACDTIDDWHMTKQYVHIVKVKVSY